MSEVLFEGNGVTSLLSVDGEEDLKPKAGINMNPPPEVERCSYCGRHISELKPFGKAGDPLVGDFDGALLVKTYRNDAPYTGVIDEIYFEFFGDCFTDRDFQNAYEKLVKRYGEKKARYLINWSQLSGHIGSGWQCRECACMDDYEFHEGCESTGKVRLLR